MSERVAPAEQVNEMWEAMVTAIMRTWDIDHAAAEEKLREIMQRGFQKGGER